MACTVSTKSGGRQQKKKKSKKTWWEIGLQARLDEQWIGMVTKVTQQYFCIEHYFIWQFINSCP